MADQKKLADKMRELAATGHPQADELVEKAAALEAAMNDFGEADSARRLLGSWARARRLWCDITGEDLI